MNQPRQEGAGSTRPTLAERDAHPSAALVIIGAELLLGRTLDTNAAHIARRLQELGFDLRRKVTVDDRVPDIAEALRDAAERADLVIATGGLGPTADDPTRAGAAAAFGRELEFREELWDQVQAIFRKYGSRPSDNNRQQAFLPAGSRAIPNPVGTAPAFELPSDRGLVFCLPGVPSEMKHLLEADLIPRLRQHFGLREQIHVRILRTAGVGESTLDSQIRDLEEADNPVVGLAAHAGQVDIRISARAPDEATARAMAKPVEAELRRRLGDWIYGADEDRLAGVVLAKLQQRGQRLVSLDAGSAAALARSLAAERALGEAFRAEVVAGALSKAELDARLRDLMRVQAADWALGICLDEAADRGRILLLEQGGEHSRLLRHGGHPELAAARASNLGLDLLRRKLGP